MLTVIATKTKGKPDYATLHINAYIRLLEEYKNDKDKSHIPSFIFHGVKYFNSSRVDTEGLDYKQLMRRFLFMEYVKCAISTQTPAELMRIFPPTKDFDGHKWQAKDYYSTMQAMKEHGLDVPIAGEVDRILWDFMNRDLMEFGVGELSLLSAIRRAEGEPGLMEEFAEQNGITTYRKYIDSTGKEFFQNSTTGEVQRVHRKRPRYLQAVN